MMFFLTKYPNKNSPVALYNYLRYQFSEFSSSADANERDRSQADDDFRVLNFRQSNNKFQRTKRRMNKVPIMPPRAQKMATDQDWGAVWPGPRTFHPATVPLPLRQGFAIKGKAEPHKYANAELMKISNFLHLTPPVIQRQCEALKKFCTPWPEGLETDEQLEEHFPIQTITSDYCHGLPTIRNPLSRIVTIKLKLSTLSLDKHAKDKFLRLVGDRYDPDTDILTLVTDRCPLRKQNYEYAQYLLAAIFHEAHITEPWEALKTEADMEEYIWSRNRSKEVSEIILNWPNIERTKQVPQSYGKSVEQLINEGENEVNVTTYKVEVLKLLELPSYTK